MTSDVLIYFPPNTHPLTLVSDPDRLLAGESVTAELHRRGFQIIQESDPALLRRRLEERRPFTTEHPVIIITDGALEDLPYDQYQPAYRLRLSLHTYFPNLVYPVLQSLNPEQVEKLGACPQPAETLSRNKTIDYLLQAVFNADPARLSQPHALIGWLNEYHQNGSPLPDLLRTGLVDRLKHYPVYQGWEIDALIRDALAFSGFIQQEWLTSLERTLSRKEIMELKPVYALSFDRDAQLQDLVPALVRQGALLPVEIADKAGLPDWSLPGITLTDVRLHRFATLLEAIDQRLQAMKTGPQAHTAWKTWSDQAQDWAECCSLNDQVNLQVNQAQKETFHHLARELDQLFPAWLQSNYSRLGAQRLPRPHHVFHIPHYLAHLRSLGQIERFVLLILDGCSLADWQVIRPAWTKRRLDWEIKTETLLAQVPTITSISRYAMISGLRPADFAGDLEHCAPEARAWETFWSKEGIYETACKLASLSLDRGLDQTPELQDPRVRCWCLIDDTLDKLAHHADLGSAGQQASLRLWLDPAHDNNSLPLETLIDDYLVRGYTVFVASDHGHVGATGFGQPNEGLLAQTRGKRVRLYLDRLAASRVQTGFPDTILWEDDGLLPETLVALMPAHRAAFTLTGDVVVTHGGISIDEMIVPLVRITKASA